MIELRHPVPINMERKDFLRAGALFTGAALFTRDVHAAQDIQGMGLVKLVDAEGNIVQAALPYAEDALEPHMDVETLHLHHAFHHGGAVKGANNHLAKLNAVDAKIAWAYVALRVLHSLFQALVNKIEVRFAIFLFSSLALLALTVRAGLALG